MTAPNEFRIFSRRYAHLFAPDGTRAKRLRSYWTERVCINMMHLRPLYGVTLSTRHPGVAGFSFPSEGSRRSVPVDVKVKRTTSGATVEIVVWLGTERVSTEEALPDYLRTTDAAEFIFSVAHSMAFSRPVVTA